jgi:hypothetical protein
MGADVLLNLHYGELEPSLLNNFRQRILNQLRSFYYWGDIEMSLYFFVGNGNGVTLREI